MSMSVVPWVTKSVKMRPMRQENLKPCPLHGLAMIKFAGQSGKGPSRKCSSGVLVYKQTSACSSGASTSDGIAWPRKLRMTSKPGGFDLAAQGIQVDVRAPVACDLDPPPLKGGHPVKSCEVSAPCE